MATTPNLGLKTFSGGDKPSWVRDWNANFNKIDEAFNDISEPARYIEKVEYIEIFETIPTQANPYIVPENGCYIFVVNFSSDPNSNICAGIFNNGVLVVSTVSLYYETKGAINTALETPPVFLKKGFAVYPNSYLQGPTMRLFRVKKATLSK